MKDLKIEYRDGKLTELVVDGVTINAASSISLTHKIHAESPEFTIAMSVTPVRSLNTDDLHSKVTLEDIEKRFGEGKAPFGGFPSSLKLSPKQEEADQPTPPDEVA